MEENDVTLEVVHLKCLEVGELVDLKVLVSSEALIKIRSRNPEILEVDGKQLIPLREGKAMIDIFVGAEDYALQQAQQSMEIEVLSEAKPHFTLAADRPRILGTDEEFQILRVKVGKAGKENHQKIWAKLKETADHYVHEQKFQVTYLNCTHILDVPLPLQQLDPIPDPPGYTDYPFWTMYSRAIEERIKILSLAYGISKDIVYANKVKEYLLALATFHRWYEFPHRGAEGNLSNAHLTLGVAMGYDAIHGILTSEERTTIQEAMMEKGLRPLSIDFRNMDNHNIIAAKQVAMLIGSLAILEECKAAHKYLNHAYDYISAYLDRRMTTSETEGLLYSNVAARHILMAADIFARATGHKELAEHPYFAELLPEQFFYFQGTDNVTNPTFANFSDSFYKLDLSYLMSMVASNNQHPVAKWYIDRFESEKVDVLVNDKDTVEPVHPDIYYQGKKSKVFKNIGWASLRTGWGEVDHMLGFTSGASNRGHNHYDQNNFILNVAGEWLITNPGYQDYVPGPRNIFTTGTVGHNALLVDGDGQKLLGNGRITYHFLSSSFGYVKGEAADSYAGAIALWEREIAHIDGSYYLVIDTVDNPRKGKLEFLYHSTSKIMADEQEVTPGTIIDNRDVVFSGEKAEAFIYICDPENVHLEVKQYQGAEEYGPYLTVQPTCTEEKQRVLTLLQPQVKSLQTKEQRSNTFSYSVEKTVHSTLLSIDRETNKQDRKDYYILNHTSQEKIVDAYETESNMSYAGQKDISFKGKQLWLSTIPAKAIGRLTKFALIEGSNLGYKDLTIFSSEKAVDISVDYDQSKDCFLLVSINSNEEQEISLYCPFVPTLPNTLGIQVVNYHSTTHQLKLFVSSGEHKLTIRS